MTIYIGIDPQPSLIATHVRHNNEILMWFFIGLNDKSFFKKAQDWQEYIQAECLKLITKLENELPKNDQLFIAIEQQRGRINSIIEQSLLCACMLKKIRRIIIHPVTWKKLASVPCLGTNRQNKKYCQDLVLPVYEAWSKKTNTLARSHDLCDAYLICLAIQVLDEEDSKTN